MDVNVDLMKAGRNKSATVAKKMPKQAEETQRWSWVEPAAWTQRMLTALQEGVKGGKWFSLIDKVSSKANIEAAYEHVKHNRGAPGVDHETVEHFEAKREEELKKLELALREGTYQPQAIKRVYIPKAGSNEKRPLGIPTVRDRIAQGAVKQVLEPIFEQGFAECSYGFRPVMEGLKEWQPEKGTPQGAVISPLLANIYLDDLDKSLTRLGFHVVRYADDLVILSKDTETAERALTHLRDWVTEMGLLKLHPNKTRIVDMRANGSRFEFLGYEFLTTSKGRIIRLPRKKSVAKLKETIRAYTRRTSGDSLKEITEKLRSILRGWLEYFKHSRRHALAPIDIWVRMRVRSILRKRSGRKGRGRGLDYLRWTNHCLHHHHGLFSLLKAYDGFCQSARR